MASSVSSDKNSAKGLLTREVSSEDWSLGRLDSKVKLVEYSDFQCPACRVYHGAIKEVLKDYGDQILFVYRHFPLQQHANAEIAALAAESAGRQGKFFEMHDLLFDNQEVWEANTNAREIFKTYATKLGLDMEKFNKDLDLREIRIKILNSYRDGVASGVNSTPSFFLNGKKIQNPNNFDDFKKLIKEAIDNAK